MQIFRRFTIFIKKKSLKKIHKFIYFSVIYFSGDDKINLMFIIFIFILYL